MSQQLIDLTGQVFGRLTVLHRVPKPDHVTSNCTAAYWLCSCECGNSQHVVQGGCLTREKGQRSCGCLLTEYRSREKIGNDNPAWKGCGEIPMQCWTRVLRGAKERNISVEITIEDANNLFIKQGRRCALTGMELLHLPIRNFTASLDRIDPTKGYVHGNVQWVHKDVNRMKWKHPEDEFIDLCRKVVQHHDAA